MKNNIKKAIYFILVIICTLILSIFLKYKLSTAQHDNNKIQNLGEFDDFTEIELTEAYVTKVIDGDTIWVKIDNEDYKVRFIGVNSPEYTSKIEPYGKEATNFTTEKLLNTTVYLQKDSSDTDKYDRLLRYVWTEKVTDFTDENISKYLFNYILVHEGLAESKQYRPNVGFQDLLDKAQEYAKENNKGMWQ